MARVLVPYGTTEGQTAKIAEAIADALQDLGHQAEFVDITRLTETALDECDAVIIGASIHMGKHDKHVVGFAKQHRDILARRPSAFFSVSLAAHGDPEEAEGYVARFEEETGWHPDQVALFGGALLYTHYGFIKRRMMRKIVEDKPGDLGTDTSRDYVYTEWDAVTRFAEHFASRLTSTAA